MFRLVIHSFHNCVKTQHNMYLIINTTLYPKNVQSLWVIDFTAVRASSRPATLTLSSSMPST